MRGNVLGPVDKTVNVLIDRSYPVVKEVFKNLDAIKGVYGKENILVDLHQNLDKIENVQEAANNLNEIHENLDELLEVQDNLTTIKHVGENLADVKKAASIVDDINNIADKTEYIVNVSDNIDAVKVVANNIDSVVSVSANIETIKQAEEHARVATESAESANTSKERAEEVLGFIEDKAAEATGLYSNIITTASSSLAQIVTTANSKQQELTNISGTYYKPSVTSEGLLMWTNTGGFSNPEPTSIRGPKGEKGDPGTGLSISGTFSTLDELVEFVPVGSQGLAYYVEATSEVYTWDVNKRSWVSIGQVKGAKGDPGLPGVSANEILMAPDPVDYFDEIYGETDLATGDLIVDISGTEPEATNIFEDALK